MSAELVAAAWLSLVGLLALVAAWWRGTRRPQSALLSAGAPDRTERFVLLTALGLVWIAGGVCLIEFRDGPGGTRSLTPAVSPEQLDPVPENATPEIPAAEYPVVPPPGEPFRRLGVLVLLLGLGGVLATRIDQPFDVPAFALALLAGSGLLVALSTSDIVLLWLALELVRLTGRRGGAVDLNGDWASGSGALAVGLLTLLNGTTNLYQMAEVLDAEYVSPVADQAVNLASYVGHAAVLLWIISIVPWRSGGSGSRTSLANFWQAAEWLAFAAGARVLALGTGLSYSASALTILAIVAGWFWWQTATRASLVVDGAGLRAVTVALTSGWLTLAIASELWRATFGKLVVVTPDGFPTAGETVFGLEAIGLGALAALVLLELTGLGVPRSSLRSADASSALDQPDGYFEQQAGLARRSARLAIGLTLGALLGLGLPVSLGYWGRVRIWMDVIGQQVGTASTTFMPPWPLLLAAWVGLWVTVLAARPWLDLLRWVWFEPARGVHRSDSPERARFLWWLVVILAVLLSVFPRLGEELATLANSLH